MLIMRFWPKAAQTIVLSFLIFLYAAGTSIGAESSDLSITSIVEALRGKHFVDLTHTADDQIPHWSGFSAAKHKLLYDYAKDGFRIEEFCHVGQWGTHVDPPGHFFAGKAMIDALPLRDMVLPLVVLDVHEKVARNPDYVLSMDDVRDWESAHGPVPEGSFVAMRTDWSKRWPSQKRMQNTDAKGISHYPGWSMEVLKYLYETRHITASGHETTDTDPGLATSKGKYDLEAYILSQGHYQIEMLDNLDEVPAAGAMVIVSWPKFKNASGFPARIFAITD